VTTLPVNDTCKLPYSTDLAIGIPVEICCNMDKPDGLYNGAYSVVRDIDILQTVWVQFLWGKIGEKARHLERHPNNTGHC